uniref:Uncharacterized protein n=1 Tax=Avena sativa TaxID=4498 RepID=A0ACD5TMN7_AVESA
MKPAIEGSLGSRGDVQAVLGRRGASQAAWLRDAEVGRRRVSARQRCSDGERRRRREQYIDETVAISRLTRQKFPFSSSPAGHPDFGAAPPLPRVYYTTSTVPLPQSPALPLHSDETLPLLRFKPPNPPSLSHSAAMTRPSNECTYAPGTPEMRLLGAATAGDLALLERMARKLDGGRGRIAEAVEAVKDRGAGALHLAAACKEAEVCEYLVEDVRVDVNAVDICGRTPLVWAITCKGGSGLVDIVRYLLDHGANPDNVDQRGFTPLHEAAKIGLCEVLELLLSRGAYVDPFSTEHGTPLHVAVIHKQDGAMKILLDHHADCNKILGSFSSPLMLAMHNRSVKCVNLLLEAGADVKGMHATTPLQAAATNGLTDVLKTLLDAGADPNVRNGFGHLPIQIAAYCGTRKDVEILFEVTTSRITAVHDWSVDGIISHVKSEPKLEDNPLSKMSVAKLKEEGNKALHQEDYDAALKFYDMAMLVNREKLDTILIGNRVFCRLHLGYAKAALNDAHFCRTMQPDSAHPCWLQGYSYVQLQEYEKACDAFLDGLKLKPRFTGIEKALREALRLLKESHADKKNGLKVEYREAHIFL